MAPKQNKGKSNQVVQTPPELLEAIKKQFSVPFWTADLAANADNAVCKTAFYGPGSPICEDSFKAQWPNDGDLWLNQEFSDIEPWAARCFYVSQKRAGRIFQLVPASTGANWFQDYLDGQAHNVFLSPRVQFVGHTHPYPKDLVLAIWSGVCGGYSTWRWKP